MVHLNLAIPCTTESTQSSPPPPPSRLLRRPSFHNLRLRMDTDLTSVSPPPSTTSSEASHRPHLGPLDLAIASAASSASTTPTGGARCKASASEPLTPPLTPSSSFSKDGSSSGPPSTPPHDGSSPSSARWARSLFTGANPSMAKPRVGRLGRGVGGYVSSAQGSPLSERPRALSESSGTPSSAVTSDADLADMFQRGLQLDVAPEADVPCTRFLVIRNVPVDAAPSVLKHIFGIPVDVQGILTKFQAEGVVVYAFYDMGHAQNAYRWVSAAGPELRQELAPHSAEGRMTAQLLSLGELQNMLGASSNIMAARGEILVSVDGGKMDAGNLQQVFSACGALKSFNRITAQSYAAEYFDVREADNVVNKFDGHHLFGSRLHLRFVHGSPLADPFASPSLGATPTPSAPAMVLPSYSPAHPQDHCAGSPHHTSSGLAVQDLLSSHRLAHAPAFRDNSVEDWTKPSLPNGIHPAIFSPSPATSYQAHAAYNAQPSHNAYSARAAMPPQYADCTSPLSMHPSWAYAPSGVPAFDHAAPNMDQMFYHASVNHEAMAGHVMQFVPPYSYSAGYAHYPLPPSTPLGDGMHYAMEYGSAYNHPQPSPSHYPPHMHGYFVMPPQAPTGPEQPHADITGQDVHAHLYPHPHPSAASSSSASTASALVAGSNGPPLSAPVLPGVPERNQLHIGRIENGQDTRTTIMIKNIPNKMTAEDLVGFINEVSPRRIDFCYLRMDFSNGCNVGYAFVNFITVQDLLHFARNRLGVKWNMYSSEKVLQMSYANYQGKEALVEKFKNSCIMDERDEWRPKIFYSYGPNQGLPEPFPPSTHLLRRARGAHNRGALYVHGPPRRGPLHRTNRVPAPGGAHSGEEARYRAPFMRKGGGA